MSETPDPLWDPKLQGDETLQRLTSLLSTYRYVPRSNTAWPTMPSTVPRKRMRRTAFAAAAAFAACMVGIAAWMPWRLQWQENRQWAVETQSLPRPVALGVGKTLATDSAQLARVKVARIGRMDVMPDTQIKLLGTRAGHHRIELVAGRVRARIWAP
ncbi:MAG: hypothetical protein DI537_48380, partial [Stutzerimonas stutzeri]